MTEPISPAIAAVSLVTLSVALFGPNAGPYIVIVLGSIGGGLWALSSTVLETRIAGIWLMLRCVVTAIVLTAMIAGITAPWLGVSVTEAYAIVAFGIGAMGNRWQDVIEILEAGINVISAVNIQHIESLNEEVKKITSIEVTERIPDKVLALADEVVNIDLTADELISRLKEGKIYKAEKIETALRNFFKGEHILQLRELALKEVASQVERKVETEVTKEYAKKHERFMACISTNDATAKTVIRKTARLANYYNSNWYVLYVQVPAESADKIALDKQRHLINNFKLATELGAEIIKVENNKVAKAIIEQAGERNITTICIGKPHLSLLKVILATNIFNELLNKLSKNDIDLVILS